MDSVPFVILHHADEDYPQGHARGQILGFTLRPTDNKVYLKGALEPIAVQGTDQDIAVAMGLSQKSRTFVEFTKVVSNGFPTSEPETVESVSFDPGQVEFVYDRITHTEIGLFGGTTFLVSEAISRVKHVLSRHGIYFRQSIEYQPEYTQAFAYLLDT